MTARLNISSAAATAAMALMLALPLASRAAEPTTGPATRPATAGPQWLAPNLGGERDHYGDDRNVANLAAVATDAKADLGMREQALRALGQTHNTKAMAHIALAAGDDQPTLRCAAVYAAWEMQPLGRSAPVEGTAFAKSDAALTRQATGIIVKALEDADARVVEQSLLAITGLKLKVAVPAVTKLLDHADPAVVAMALGALTDLGSAAPADKLAAAIKSTSNAVRLRAAQNVLLTDKCDFVADLTAIATKDLPQLQAAALAALGKFAFNASKDLIASAAANEDPFVRRGALWAYRQAGKKDRIKPFLSDKPAKSGKYQPSEMVQLAAIGAAGEIKSADCAGAIYEMMLAAKDPWVHESKAATPAGRRPLVHYAARDALAAIGGDEVATLAADTVRNLADEKNWTDAVKVRNIRAALWLLGTLRSDKEYDTRLKILNASAFNSKVLVETAISLGQLDKKEACEPLRNVLAKLAAQAPRALSAAPDPEAKFDHEVTVAVIRALGMLRDADAMGVFETVVNTRTQAEPRLAAEAAEIAQVLPLAADEKAMPAAKRMMTNIIKDGNYGPLARFYAVRSAANMKFGGKDTVDAMKAFLKERHDRNTMIVCAWAVKLLTGESLDIPEPTLLEGEWIIKHK